MRDDVVARFLEADQLAIALDVHAPLCEPRDEEALVLVLRVDEPERIRALACAKSPQLDAGPPLASGPEIRRREDEPCVDDLAGEAELAVQLQRARLHRKGTRGRARLGSLVDDADPYARPREPESEYESRRTSADDENFAVHGCNLSLHRACQRRSSAATGPGVARARAEAVSAVSRRSRCGPSPPSCSCAAAPATGRERRSRPGATPASAAPARPCSSRPRRWPCRGWDGPACARRPTQSAQAIRRSRRGG